MKRWVSFILMHGIAWCLMAQGVTLSGVVVDKENGKPLANVIVMLKTEDGKAIFQYSTTNDKGVFSYNRFFISQGCVLFLFRARPM